MKPCTNDRYCKSKDLHANTCPIYKAAVEDWKQNPDKYSRGPVVVAL